MIEIESSNDISLYNTKISRVGPTVSVNTILQLTWPAAAKQNPNTIKYVKKYNHKKTEWIKSLKVTSGPRNPPPPCLRF